MAEVEGEVVEGVEDSVSCDLQVPKIPEGEGVDDEEIQGRGQPLGQCHPTLGNERQVSGNVSAYGHCQDGLIVLADRRRCFIYCDRGRQCDLVLKYDVMMIPKQMFISIVFQFHTGI